MKKILLNLILISITPVYAFEDCLISTDGKLTDIKIEHNNIVDICPVITIMNEKNTLLVHPLQTGETKASVIKNGKEEIIFNIKVTNNKTTINETEGFDIIKIDTPPEAAGDEIDPPPMLREIGQGE